MTIVLFVAWISIKTHKSWVGPIMFSVFLISDASQQNMLDILRNSYCWLNSTCLYSRKYATNIQLRNAIVYSPSMIYIKQYRTFWYPILLSTSYLYNHTKLNNAEITFSASTRNGVPWVRLVKIILYFFFVLLPWAAVTTGNEHWANDSTSGSDSSIGASTPSNSAPVNPWPQLGQLSGFHTPSLHPPK